METGQDKCVIVADGELPAGVLANTAAILGMTLGKRIPECVGEAVSDGSGHIHEGITGIPVPVLRGDRETLRRLREMLFDPKYGDMVVVDFSDVAQSCATYDRYVAKAEGLAETDFTYLGIALYGDKKRVNSLTGSLPLFR